MVVVTQRVGWVMVWWGQKPEKGGAPWLTLSLIQTLSSRLSDITLTDSLLLLLNNNNTIISASSSSPTGSSSSRQQAWDYSLRGVYYKYIKCKLQTGAKKTHNHRIYTCLYMLPGIRYNRYARVQIHVFITGTRCGNIPTTWRGGVQTSE